MAAKKEAATGDRQITRSATVPVKGITIDDILAGAADVEAPNSARVSTGGAPYNPDGVSEYNYSVTYTWEDTL